MLHRLELLVRATSSASKGPRFLVHRVLHVKGVVQFLAARLTCWLRRTGLKYELDVRSVAAPRSPFRSQRGATTLCRCLLFVNRFPSSVSLCFTSVRGGLRSLLTWKLTRECPLRPRSAYARGPASACSKGRQSRSIPVADAANDVRSARWGAARDVEGGGIYSAAPVLQSQKSKIDAADESGGNSRGRRPGTGKFSGPEARCGELRGRCRVRASLPSHASIRLRACHSMCSSANQRPRRSRTSIISAPLGRRTRKPFSRAARPTSAPITSTGWKRPATLRRRGRTARP